MRFLKFIWRTLVIGVGLYLLFVLFIVIRFDLENYFRQTDFNSERWKTWEMTIDEASLRWDMIDDLKDNYELNGITEKEIVELLGEPGSKSKAEWIYSLGMTRRGIDTGTLKFDF